MTKPPVVSLISCSFAILALASKLNVSQWNSRHGHSGVKGQTIKTGRASCLKSAQDVGGSEGRVELKEPDLHSHIDRTESS